MIEAGGLGWRMIAAMSPVEVQLSLRTSAACGYPVVVKREGRLWLAWSLDEGKCLFMGATETQLEQEARKHKESHVANLA